VVAVEAAVEAEVQVVGTAMMVNVHLVRNRLSVKKE
jgi:hypothetical protein